MSNILAELRQQALDPPASDERIAAFSQAVLGMDESTAGDMLTIIEDRRFETASYGANLLLRAVQKQLLRVDPEYPAAYDDTEVWEKALDDLVADDSRVAELANDLTHKTTQSNVVERYKAFKLLIELLSPQVGEAPSILDIGCSRNHGLKKLHLNLPFGPIRLGLPGAESRVSGALVDRLANTLIAAPRAYGLSTGMDLTPLAVPGQAEWGRSCSFYPSELLNAEAVAEYDFLEEAHPPGAHFKQGDVLLMAADHTKTYDVVTASTFLYQLSPAQRLAARTALKNAVSDEGLIIYQDFVRRTGDQNLSFEDSWFARQYPYRTIVEFPHRSEPVLYEALRWSTGRCKEWVPGRDLDNLINNENIAN